MIEGMNSRQCFYVAEYQPALVREYGGFVPSLVTEGMPGHQLLIGRDEYSVPWVWGETHAEAQQVADDYNAQLGLKPEDVSAIILSSKAASAPSTLETLTEEERQMLLNAVSAMMELWRQRTRFDGKPIGEEASEYAEAKFKAYTALYRRLEGRGKTVSVRTW